MRQITTIILALSLATNTLAVSEFGDKVADATAQLEKIKTASSSTRSIESDFTLVKKMSLMSDIEKSYGKFYYSKASSQLCLDYTEPADNKILISDTKFTLTTNGKTSSMQLSRNPALSQLKNMITACMTGNFMSLGEHSETSYYDNGSTFTISIKPSNKRVKRYMNEIVLRFDKKDNTLMSMRLAEPNGDYSEYTYTNKKINTVIDNKHFLP